MRLDTNKLSPQETYHYLVGGIIPRPIAWISTISQAGISNLAPYSFFTVASCNPPVLLYTQTAPRIGNNKDTLANILETKSCVINVVSAEQLEKMNETCATIPREISEFSTAGIEACKSHVVKAPSVADSKVRYECTLREIIQVSQEPLGGTVVLLDVLCIHVGSGVLLESKIDHHALDVIGRLGGDEYSYTRQTKFVPRP